MDSVSCKNCGNSFDAERKSAKFCSAECRVKFARKLVKETGVTTADKIPPKKEKSEMEIKFEKIVEEREALPQKNSYNSSPYINDAIRKKLGW